MLTDNGLCIKTARTIQYNNLVKKKPKYNENATIRGALRRQFSRSPIVREVMGKVRREIPKYNKDGSRAKKDAVQYRCSPCGEWVGSTRCAVDHISPVIAVEDGFVDWNNFVSRLFCGADNLQVICDTCHNQKTNAERIARLTKQYTEELDKIEVQLNIADNHRNLYGAANAFDEMIQNLKKYIAKKKTIGLEPIVERALRLKERALDYKDTTNDRKRKKKNG